MTTTIGSVTLDRDMVFKNEYQYKLVNGSVTPTIGGGVVVQEFPKLEKGRLIDLTSEDTIGVQRKSTIDALMVLAAVPQATYTFTMTTGARSITKTVRFRNEEEYPVDFEPYQHRGGVHADDIWYKGTIKLMVV